MNVYEIITERIIAKLDAGIIPWHKPWSSPEMMPKSFNSRKEYRGINVMLLGCAGFPSPWWLTFKQAQERGGMVRKGEKGTPVIFWKWLDRKGAASPDPDEINVNGSRVPMLRYYTVFNAAQIDGIEFPAVETTPQTFKPIDAAAQVVSGMPNAPAIKHGNGAAFYRPAEDFVGMPDPEKFESAEAYHATLFHELTHSTGHASRCNRKASISEWSRFGSQSYSREELVAEMGAAFLCGVTGIIDPTLDQSVAYIQSWRRKLHDDPKAVVVAAAQAQKAADYIRGIKHGE